MLKGSYEIGASAPVEAMRSVDGTVKYLFRTPTGNFVEAVYIPDEDRATLCVSSQVGCKMNCKFCMTGKQGFTANLTAQPDSEPDIFYTGTRYADQSCVYGDGRAF